MNTWTPVITAENPPKEEARTCNKCGECYVGPLHLCAYVAPATAPAKSRGMEVAEKYVVLDGDEAARLVSPRFGNAILVKPHQAIASDWIENIRMRLAEIVDAEIVAAEQRGRNAGIEEAAKQLAGVSFGDYSDHNFVCGFHRALAVVRELLK